MQYTNTTDAETDRQHTNIGRAYAQHHTATIKLKFTFNCLIFRKNWKLYQQIRNKIFSETLYNVCNQK